MAHRIHIVAARDVTATEFQRALTACRSESPGEAACSPFRFGSSGDWQWALASVWHVGVDVIDQWIGTLPGVALRTTTSDGVLWMLAVASPGRELFRGVHFFTSVGRIDWDDVADEPADEDDPAFPEHSPDEVVGIDRSDSELQFLWDEQEAAAVEAQSKAAAEAETPWKEYVDYGVVFTEDVLRRMENLPARAAERVAFHSHAEQIAVALAERGIPLDREALVRLLTIEPLTRQERASDLGNLPHFLSLLGIDCFAKGESAPEAEVEAMEDQERVDWNQFSSREHMQAVRTLLAGREPAPVRGGLLDVTLPEVVHLLTIAHFCDADDGPVMITLRVPTDDFILASAWTNLGDRGVEFERVGACCTIAFNPVPHWLDVEERTSLAQHALVQAIGTLPDGVEVELVHSVAGTGDGCHRYRSVTHEGGLRVTAAYPPVAANVIREALALLQLTLGKKSIPIDDSDEELRMREAYHYVTGEKARIRNGRIKPEAGRHAVVRCKFVTRFSRRGVWDIEGAERRRLEVLAEIDSLLQGVGLNDERDTDEETADAARVAEAAEAAERFQGMIERARRANLVPRTDDLIYEGKVSRYFHAPILALEGVTADEVTEKDREMAELGFAWVCDSASERFGETISRSYAGVGAAIAIYDRKTPANSHSFNNDGVLLDLSRGVLEFQTHFRDGSTIVTNNIDAATSIPKKHIYVRTYENLSVAGLWVKHLDGVSRLAARRKTEPWITPSSTLQLSLPRSSIL